MKRVVSSILLMLLASAGAQPLLAQKRPKPQRRVANYFREEPARATSFYSAESLSSGQGALVRWQMKVELANLGFVVYRTDGSGTVLVKEGIVPGSAMRSRSSELYGGRYATFDPDGSPASKYVVEAIQLDGSRITAGQIATNYVDNLEKAAGEDAVFIRKDAEANSLVQDVKQIMSDELRAEVEANLQSPDPANQLWVASQPGAKIGVKHEGIYRVTRAQLEAANFNVSSNPELWQLYADGVQQSIIVGPNGDYIEFYGKGIDTQESDTKFYYLIVGGTPGLRIQTASARRVGGTVTLPNFLQTAVRKERLYYLNEFLNGDRENYWGRFISTTPTTFTFNLSGVDSTVGTATVRVKFLGFSNAPHAVNLVLNGQNIGQATAPSGNREYAFETTVPVTALNSGNNSLVMSGAASADFNFFDSVTVTYARKFAADANRLSFVTQNYRGTTVTGFSSSAVRVFDITRDSQPVLMGNLPVTASGNTFDVTIPPHRGRLYYAVESSAVAQPASVTQNTPSTLSTPSHAADLVIIAYKDFMAQAETWANYRRGQGFSVEVIDVEDIFDEYNYGSPGSRSMRSFLRYAKDNWQTPPRYVLLVGDGSYDPRNYEGLGNFNYVPAFIVNTVYSETASDDAIVDFNGDGLAEMAIGRIPARTTAQITNALNKTMMFEQPAMQSLSRGALFACDSSNSYNFCGMSGRLRDQLPAGTPNRIVSRAEVDARTTLINEMNLGKYVINYSGHGTLGVWASDNFFGNQSVPLLTNQNSPSLYVMLTCLNGFFHEITRSSLAENLLNSTAGGGAAAWASSGLTTPDVQELMGQRFFNKIGGGSIPRMGDLIIDAKSTVPGGSDVRESWVLIGDPMLKVR